MIRRSEAPPLLHINTNSDLEFMISDNMSAPDRYRFPALLLLVFFLFFGLQSASAQRQIAGVEGMPPVRFGALAGGDYDGDGDEDVFLTGELQDGTIHSALYRFVERRVTPIPMQSPRITAVYQRVPFPKRDVKGGSVVWKDLNNDGMLDILVTGLALEEVTTDSEVFRAATDIYINGNGTFFINGLSGLPGVHNSRADAADFNGDGIMDIVLGGETDTGVVLGVWVADSSGFYSPGPTTFEGLSLSSLDIADMDDDGDQDFVVGGFTASGRPVVRLFRNNGDASFVEVDADLPELYFASASFGDIDFDGDSDILVSGGRLAPTILRGSTTLHRNDGSGNFTQTETSLTGLFAGGSLFGDLDGDTDLDFVTWGQQDLSDPESQKLLLYENIDLSFLQIANLRGVLFGTLNWFDSDGNGRLDILLTGEQEGELIITLFEF